MPETPSHFQDLLQEADEREAQIAGPIPVEVIPPAAERSDGGTIFDEGEAFSGIVRRGSAESVITPVTAPHTTAQVSRERFVAASEKVLGRPVAFSEGLERAAGLPHQLLVWWRQEGTEADYSDIVQMAGLSEQEKADFAEAIAAQTVKAAQIVDSFGSKPTIWGSWGHGVPEDRELSGRNRGVPTNKMGHLHIVNLRDAPDFAEPAEDLSAAQKLNHYAPWGALLHRKFSQPIGRVIGEQFSTSLDADVTVEPFSEVISGPDGQARRVNDGYEIEFDSPITQEEAFLGLVGVAGAFENLYQRATEHQEAHHKNAYGPGSSEQAEAGIAAEAAQLGFSDQESRDFARFVLMIRPTYAQLSRWDTELQGEDGKDQAKAHVAALKKAYERAQSLLEAHPDLDSYSTALIRDTVAKPEDTRSVGRTWAEHASATYVIDDYELTAEGIKIRSLKLYPGVDSTEAAPELVRGQILARPTGS